MEDVASGKAVRILKILRRDDLVRQDFSRQIGRVLGKGLDNGIAEGRPLQRALDDALTLFDEDVDLGLIAVSEHEAAAASNRGMPIAIREC